MKTKHRIPAGVWILGFVSMLMDVSSEMIHSLLPLYLTVGLGASALTVGIIEGVAEATALIVKVFSGALSVREPPVVEGGKPEKVHFDKATMRKLGIAFWSVTLIGSALTLARFSEAFLILRSQDLGLEVALAPLVMVGMNVVYAGTAYPVGKLADRMSPNTLLFIGTGLLIAADVALAIASSMTFFAIGVP